jgi:hypothetical protein
MPERDVCSPVNTSHGQSKLSNKVGLSPGARSMPDARRDSVPNQPSPHPASHSEAPPKEE